MTCALEPTIRARCLQEHPCGADDWFFRGSL